MAEEIVDAVAEPLSDMDILNATDDAPEVPTESKPEEVTPPEPTKPELEEEPEVKSEPSDEEKQPETDEKDAEKKPDAAKQPVDEPAGVKALREAFTKNPALKTALDADPALRNRLFANARRSEELTTYKEQFATPELAKEARTSAEDLTNLEADLSSRSPKGYDSVLQRISEFSLQRDAQGQPIIGANGAPLSNGLLEEFFGHQRTAHFWPAVLSMAESQGADDIAEAAQMVMEFLGDAKAAPGTSAKVDDVSTLSPQVRERLAKLDTLERQQGTQTQEVSQQFEKTVSTEAVTSVRSMIDERVKRFAPALSPAIQRRITDDALAEINGIAGKDTIYRNSYLNQLRRANNSPESKTLLVGKATSYARSVAGPIIQKLVREFSDEAVAANQEKVAKLDTQKAKANVKGAGGPSNPTRQGDLHSMIREGKTLSNSLFKRDLTDMEILNIENTVDTFRRMSADRKR